VRVVVMSTHSLAPYGAVSDLYVQLRVFKKE